LQQKKHSGCCQVMAQCSTEKKNGSKKSVVLLLEKLNDSFYNKKQISNKSLFFFKDKYVIMSS
jgi:hypothetical protein